MRENALPPETKLLTWTSPRSNPKISGNFAQTLFLDSAIDTGNNTLKPLPQSSELRNLQDFCPRLRGTPSTIRILAVGLQRQRAG